MTTSEVIAAAWEVLAQESHTHPGIYRRRVFADSQHSLFAGVERPSLQPRIELHLPVSRSHLADVNLRGMSLKAVPIGLNQTSVEIQLSKAAYRDVFGLLVGDVVDRVLTASTPEAGAETAVARLVHWQRFLENADPNGLSSEQQTGLFGELVVLESLLRASSSPAVALEAWHGPAAENQDFVVGDRAIEVKTSATNDQDTIFVANEHQLDDSSFAALYLCHVAVELRSSSGVSLPAMVAEVAVLLPDELREEFANRLALAGYLPAHEQLYVQKGFVQKRRRYFRVSDGFPRLLPQNLSSGISRVSYSVNLSGCTSFRAEEVEVLSACLGHSHD